MHFSKFPGSACHSPAPINLLVKTYYNLTMCYHNSTTLCLVTVLQVSIVIPIQPCCFGLAKPRFVISIRQQQNIKVR